MTARDELRKIMEQYIPPSEQKRAYSLVDRTVEEEGHIDFLTKLPNRHVFFPHMQRHMVRAARTQEPLCILMIDADRFKDVNDHGKYFAHGKMWFGHDAGDRLLEDMADVLRKSLRPGDIVARLGGEEFAIGLPSRTTVDDAKIVAERINRKIFTTTQHTVSIGVAAYSPLTSECSIETLLSNADAAVYAAKAAGRNRYVIYTPDLARQSL